MVTVPQDALGWIGTAAPILVGFLALEGLQADPVIEATNTLNLQVRIRGSIANVSSLRCRSSGLRSRLVNCPRDILLLCGCCCSVHRLVRLRDVTAGLPDCLLGCSGHRVTSSSLLERADLLLSTRGGRSQFEVDTFLFPTGGASLSHACRRGICAVKLPGGRPVVRQSDRGGPRAIPDLGGAPTTVFMMREPRVVRDSAQVGTLFHGVLLAMEVRAVLNVVDLRDELFLDRVAGMQAVKRLLHHELQVVVGLLNLADVDSLELQQESKRVRTELARPFFGVLTSFICVNQS